MLTFIPGYLRKNIQTILPLHEYILLKIMFMCKITFSLRPYIKLV